MDALIISYGTASPGACLVRRGAVSGVRFESEYLEDAPWPRLFPDNAAGGLFRDAGIKGEELGNVVVCGKPFSMLEKLLNVHMFFFPRYFGAFVKDLTDLFSEKLAARSVIRKKTGFNGDTLFFDTMDILASARGTSVAEGEAVVVSLGDSPGAAAVGIYKKKGGRMFLEKELSYPRAFSAICDIYASSAPGADIAVKDAIKVSADGSFYLNSRYFSYSGGKIKLSPGALFARKDAEDALLGITEKIMTAVSTRGGKAVFISDHDVPDDARSMLEAEVPGLVFERVTPADILRTAAEHYINIRIKEKG